MEGGCSVRDCTRYKVRRVSTVAVLEGTSVFPYTTGERLFSTLGPKDIQFKDPIIHILTYETLSWKVFGV